MGEKLRSHTDLEVFNKAFDSAMRLFELSKSFPKEETYSLTDQIRRSSRSACANFAEAWRKRKYQPAFVCKLVECEGEAAETQVWIQFAVRCEYMSREDGVALYGYYNEILRMLVAIRNHPEDWILGHG